jgi:hypothetical protein
MKKLILSLVLSSIFVGASATTFAYHGNYYYYDTSSQITHVDYTGYEGWYYGNYCTGINNHYYGERVLCNDIEEYNYYPNYYEDEYTTGYYNDNYSYNHNNYNYYDDTTYYYPSSYNNYVSPYNSGYYDFDYYYSSPSSYNSSYYYNDYDSCDYHPYSYDCNDSYIFNYSYIPVQYSGISAPYYYNYTSPNYNDPNFRNYRQNVYTCADGKTYTSPFDCNRYR